MVPDAKPASAIAPHGASDDAWRLLELVVEWIKHAEAKAAATLGAAGVLGGLLYTLAYQMAVPDATFAVSAMICAGAVVTSAAAAVVALRPRLRAGGPASGLLYYQSIAQNFPDGPVDYAREFLKLVGSQPATVDAIAHQIWANSVVATQKYRALNLAVIALVVGLVTLAVSAVIALFAR
jgi:hypothetical protein